MNNVYIRLLTYMMAGGAVALAASGVATFDPSTGDFDLLPFNIYNLAGLIGGLVAPFVVFKKWGTK